MIIVNQGISHIHASEIRKMRNPLRRPSQTDVPDCLSSLSRLPEGPLQSLWLNKARAREGHPCILPFHVSHVNNNFSLSWAGLLFVSYLCKPGTCEIIFDVSSPGVDSLKEIRVLGEVVRRMAGVVIGYCVEREDSDNLGGGFMTQWFEKLLHTLFKPLSRFLEDLCS